MFGKAFLVWCLGFINFFVKKITIKFTFSVESVNLMLIFAEHQKNRVANWFSEHKTYTNNPTHIVPQGASY